MFWKSLGPLLQIINKLLEWFEQHKREQDYEERQEKRDKAATDPGSVFRDHFGVRNNTADAHEANKADSGNSDKPG